MRTGLSTWTIWSILPVQRSTQYNIYCSLVDSLELVKSVPDTFITIYTHRQISPSMGLLLRAFPKTLNVQRLQ